MSKSFYVKITGGLGNQMFQFASTFALAKSQDCKLKLETSFYKDQDLRSFELDETFYITSKVAKESSINKKFPLINTPILRKLIRDFNSFLPVALRRIYTEKSPNYDPNFMDSRPTCLLIGYWQSYKYFEKYRDDILKQFSFKLQIPDTEKNILQQIQSTDSVSMHIRRGDYISNPSAFKVHGTCDLNYYNRGLDHIRGHLSNFTVFVFSDDIEWCKDNFKHLKNAVFINPKKENSTQIDLQLMANCKHNIIANSSYSWWAAWLNINNNKIVIAPKKWNNVNPDFNLSIIPKEWIQL